MLERTIKFKIREKQIIRKFRERYVYIGEDLEGVPVWSPLPRWDCDWYWGACYLQGFFLKDKDIHYHTHFQENITYSSAFHKPKLLKNIVISETDYFYLLELTGLFYAYKNVAEFHHTNTKNYVCIGLHDYAEYKKINETTLPIILKKIYNLFIPTEKKISIDGKTKKVKIITK